jgi:hypothetical protein
MNSMETLAKRVGERGGDLHIHFKEFWKIRIYMPNYNTMVYGKVGDSLSKVANKANGVFK